MIKFLSIVLAAVVALGFITSRLSAAETPKQAKSLTSKNHKSEVETSKIPVLIKFGATWCGPCRDMKPIVNKLAAELKGKVNILDCDVDDEPGLTSQYGVSRYPTFVLISSKGHKFYITGKMSESALRKWIDDNKDK